MGMSVAALATGVPAGTGPRCAAASTSAINPGTRSEGAAAPVVTLVGALVGGLFGAPVVTLVVALLTMGDASVVPTTSAMPATVVVES
jgi:hypothetical protein